MENVFDSLFTSEKSSLAHLPTFPISASQVEVLYEPSDFYQKLLHLSSTCKNRMVISTLYLGTGDLEKKLRDTWLKTWHQRQMETETIGFRMKFLLSFTRGSRLSPEQESSRTMLLPLVKAAAADSQGKASPKNHLQVALYCNPHLRGLLGKALPERFNEVLGLQHMKIYLFDDTLLMTGVNLSGDYFTNRQDRSYAFHGVRSLGDFCEDLVDTVSGLSYRLTSKNNVVSNCPIDPRTGNLEAYISHGRTAINSFLKRHEPKPGSSMVQSTDTQVRASIQMRVFGVDQQHQTFLHFLEHLPQHLHHSPDLSPANFSLHLATGYFNPLLEYEISLLKLVHSHNRGVMKQQLFDVTLLTSSPEANGFLNSSGLSKHIPTMYLDFTHRFLRLVEKERVTTRCKVLEYYRPGWTFHGKGMWLSGFQRAHRRVPEEERTVVTEIGSTNYGYRSVLGDLELQMYVGTKNETLQRQMARERQALYVYAQTIHYSSDKPRSSMNPLVPDSPYRKVPRWIHRITPLLRRFA